MKHPPQAGVRILCALFVAAASLMGSAVQAAQGDIPKHVGYIVNYATHEWYRNVIAGMQERAKQLGISLEVRDANLDINKQVSAAEDFIAKGVDAMIITPVNQEGVTPILRRAKAAKIPVVLESSPVKGGDVLVAVCDYDTGYNAGVAAGELAKKRIKGKIRVMNVGLPLWCLAARSVCGTAWW